MQLYLGSANEAYAGDGDGVVGPESGDGRGGDSGDWIKDGLRHGTGGGCRGLADSGDGNGVGARDGGGRCVEAGSGDGSGGGGASGDSVDLPVDGGVGGVGYGCGELGGCAEADLVVASDGNGDWSCGS